MIGDGRADHAAADDHDLGQLALALAERPPVLNIPAGGGAVSIPRACTLLTGSAGSARSPMLSRFALRLPRVAD
jgi:hypothetical protein